MRTAVVRVNVDPAGVLTSERLREGMDALLAFAQDSGVEVVKRDLGRDIELLIACDAGESARATATALCAEIFDTAPVAGVITFISRGTDDDAHGVLAGFGLNGEIVREADNDGFDIIHVTLRESDLDRIPESRIHTALEASLNCEVHIHTS